ncbi:MAG: PaaI family thioesterase [Pirellulales bacterium]|nr:PaaI family thioesterase [Pirellulales bacterium]
MADIAAIPFAHSMGVEILEASPERIVGLLTVRADLCTAGEILHGGAIMAFADTLGAIGAYFNLPEGATRTTTIASSTSFVAAAKLGEQVRAESTPVHLGRRTSVWQTRLTVEPNRTVAVITQTQMAI